MFKFILSLLLFVCLLNLLPIFAADKGKREPVSVYVERSRDDDGKFSDLLKVELNKRKGAIKTTIEIIRDPEQARYILEANVSRRKGKWHEGWLTPDKAETMAAVIAYDRCGRMVWSKNKGDMTLFGSGGDVLVAQKIAASFKSALAKKKSRINQARPCSE